jgi:hypothetical protein
MLYVQRVGSSEVRALQATQGASYPFWSPDGAYLGFSPAANCKKRSTVARLKRLPKWARRAVGAGDSAT